MNTSGPDAESDELDVRLRALFADDRLDIPTAARAEQIVAGARRIRRRRVMLTGGGTAAAVVAAAIVGLAMADSQNQGDDDVRIAATPPSTGTQTFDASVMVDPVESGSTAPSEPDREEPESGDNSRPTESPSADDDPPPESGTTESGPPAVTQLSLERDGYRSLKLGMPSHEAADTQLLVFSGGNFAPQPCTDYSLAEGDGAIRDVTISRKEGLVRIRATGATTPEGVGVGTPVDTVRTVYPEGSGDGNLFQVDVGEGTYEFVLDNGVVRELRLVDHDFDC